MPESEIPKPEIVVIAKATPTYVRVLRYLGMGGLTVFLIIVVFFLLAPLDFYLKLYAFFTPRALAINNNSISWDQLRKELSLVSLDKNLKTRSQKLERAINNSLELQILRTSIAVPSAATSPPLTLFAEHMILKDQIEQNSVNWRTGGFFIARFTIPQATESAQVLKNKALSEITGLKKRLDKKENFQKILDEATQSATLKYLNGGAFLPGLYLEKITQGQFPLKIKGLRDKFFSMPEKSVSDILVLSWDDYYGESYGQKFNGEFAYAIIKIEAGNPHGKTDYETWLKEQKQKITVFSNVFIPFFFKWF